jgi:hypothetical protein
MCLPVQGGTATFRTTWREGSGLHDGSAATVGPWHVDCRLSCCVELHACILCDSGGPHWVSRFALVKACACDESLQFVGCCLSSLCVHIVNNRAMLELALAMAWMSIRQACHRSWYLGRTNCKFILHKYACLWHACPVNIQAVHRPQHAGGPAATRSMMFMMYTLYTVSMDWCIGWCPVVLVHV